MTPISIYIHWPFCAKKCPYCDFNSFVQDKIDHDKWSDAYIIAIDHYAKFLNNKQIKSIFFGGGTPSLATPMMIKNIIDHLKSITTFSNNIEITLEANPTSVEAVKFSQFKDVGINRISLGVQSLRNENLKFLGRNHSSDEAITAIEILKSNFENYSLDFIYALPDQTLEAWEKELNEAISLASNHLSLYQLTIENGTKFGAMAKAGLLNEIDEIIASEMFKLTNDITTQNGFNRYEVSNHAKFGFESIHNLNYWEYGDYIGIGPGAHGRYNSSEGKIMTVDIKQPDLWIKSLFEKANGLHLLEKLSAEDIRIETIMMGIRTKYGIPLELLHNKEQIIKELTNDQLVEVIDNRVKITDKGLIILNSVTGYLIV
jgi:putative oxygen-independent coproporphyrinogen III oxidase